MFLVGGFFFLKKSMSVIYHTCEPYVPALEWTDPHKSFYCPYSGRSYINQWLAATKTIDEQPVSWKKLVSFIKKGTKSGCIKFGEWVVIHVKVNKKGEPNLKLELHISKTVELEYQYPAFLYSVNAIFRMLARNNLNAKITDQMIVTASKCYSFTPHIAYPDCYTFMIQSLDADESEATKASSKTSDWQRGKPEILNPPDYDNYFRIVVSRKESPVDKMYMSC